MNKTEKQMAQAARRFAELYDPLTMPPELRKAHRDNDHAVMATYGFDTTMNESEIDAQLFSLYSQLVTQQ